MKPIQRNVSKWTSSFDMVNSYSELKPHLEIFVDLLLSPRENNDAEQLKGKAEKMLSVSEALQSESSYLVDARKLLDAVLIDYEDDEFAQYSQPDLQLYRIHSLKVPYEKSRAKKKKNVRRQKAVFKMRVIESPRAPSEVSDISETPKDYAPMQLKAKKTEIAPKTQYIDTGVLIPTSNLLESLSSSAGYTYNDFRKKTFTNESGDASFSARQQTILGRGVSCQHHRMSFFVLFDRQYK